jgi:hypothetical protein
MNIATVLEIITLVEIAEENTKQDPKYKEDFECSTKGEYQAYLKGQKDSLLATINHLQSYIEGQLHGEENKSAEQ